MQLRLNDTSLLDGVEFKEIVIVQQILECLKFCCKCMWTFYQDEIAILCIPEALICWIDHGYEMLRIKNRFISLKIKIK